MSARHTLTCGDCGTVMQLHYDQAREGWYVRKPGMGLFTRCDGVEVCFDCLPAKEFVRYKGWRERVMRERRKEARR